MEGAVGGLEHGDVGTEVERRVNSQRRPTGGHTVVRLEARAGPPSSKDSQGRAVGAGS